MNDFNLKQFLQEQKLTKLSTLSENYSDKVHQAFDNIKSDQGFTTTDSIFSDYDDFNDLEKHELMRMLAKNNMLADSNRIPNYGKSFRRKHVPDAAWLDTEDVEEMFEEELLEKSGLNTEYYKEILNQNHNNSDLEGFNTDEDAYNVLQEEQNFSKIKGYLQRYGSQEDIKQYLSSVQRDFERDSSGSDYEGWEEDDYIEDFKNYVADRSLEESSFLEEEQDFNIPDIINFGADFQSTVKYGPETQEYEAFESIQNEDDWENYWSEMQSKGIVISYDNTEDIYVVSSVFDSDEDNEDSFEEESDF
jgi:hypothetical protein